MKQSNFWEKKLASTLKDFDYELPKELIAPYPTPKRSEARLMVLERSSGKIDHKIFKDLPDYLKAGDLLVLNNTRVLPARLFGKKATGGRVEVLLLKQINETSWEILLKPSGRVKEGSRIQFGENGIRLEGEVFDRPSGITGIRSIRFDSDHIKEKLAQIGRVPLPPYIDRPDEAIDRELYQTVFAEVDGAVASPTAGLHFDDELLKQIKDRGIESCFVTLHVSYGTFQPVQTEDLSKHEMFEEEFEITGRAAEQIQNALRENRRIVACGTTVVRVLESMEKKLGPKKGKTRLFIYPPYHFQFADLMITNFHLPKSTLLMLASAFAGHDLLFKAYEEAIRNQYRFYSYGDAMLIL